MKTIREWLGKVRAKWRITTQKLKLPGKYKRLFNFRIILLLVFLISIALGVVFSQYPQVLTSFAKPPQKPCGFEDDKRNSCCKGDVCNPGLKCYSPDTLLTPKKCTSLGAICGNAVNKPCCKSSISDEQDNSCNAKLDLVCDSSKDPPYSYQNPWNTGMCARSYGTCGGQDEECCYTAADKGRCDGTLTCLNWVEGSLETCDYKDVTTFAMQPLGKIYANQVAGFWVDTQYNGQSYTASFDCDNQRSFTYASYFNFNAGVSEDDLGNTKCIFTTPGIRDLNASLSVRSPSNGDRVFDKTISIEVLDQPTPTPTQAPTAPACDPSKLNMSVNPNPGTDGNNMTFSLSGGQGSTLRDDFWSGGVNCSGGFWGNLTCRATKTGSYSWIHYWKNCAPNNCNITSAQCSKIKSFTVQSEAAPTATNTPIPTYTCNGTCIFGTNECYQVGSGTCPSNKYCCKIINSPTPILATNTPAPTKAPNGAPCSSASQCISAICKTCPSETQGYCRPSGYACQQ